MRTLESIIEVKDKRELRYEGTVNLIGALFRLTAQDIRQGSKEAEEFLDSEWFNDICEGLQVNPKVFKEYMLHKKVRSRVSYE